MRASSSVSAVAIFTALIVGSDFALTPVVNVKLLDTLVFVVAFVFGLRVGAAVAVLSETIWSLISPWGMGGAITPFLVGGELLFAMAGFAASRIWETPKGFLSLSSQNLFFGATLAICAFVWDLETNLATGLLAGANTFTGLLAYEVYGIPFMIPHELSDFVLGSVLAPIAIVYTSRMLRRGGSEMKSALGIPELGSQAN